MSALKLIPRISEKAIGSAERGVYIFEVPTATNKVEVARAVADRFKVEVVAVNMLITKGKAKRFRQIRGRESDFKRAMVKLKKGQTIALFEGGK